jgi:hypothetical protein
VVNSEYYYKPLQHINLFFGSAGYFASDFSGVKIAFPLSLGLLFHLCWLNKRLDLLGDLRHSCHVVVVFLEETVVCFKPFAIKSLLCFFSAEEPDFVPLLLDFSDLLLTIGKNVIGEFSIQLSRCSAECNRGYQNKRKEAR